MNRVGMFGGSFDPPHLAHEALAQIAVGELELEVLRVFPTGQAWHKGATATSAKDRLAMARLAFNDIPDVLVDSREITRPGPTYTIDTLRELSDEYPHAELFLVMGEDQAAAFTTWKDHEEILVLATLAIAERPTRQTNPKPIELPPGARVERLRYFSPMPDSATAIRNKVAAGEGIAELVSGGVARYIASHHLYQRS